MLAAAAQRPLLLSLLVSCCYAHLQEVKSRLKDIMGRLMHPDQTWAAMEELNFLRK